MALRATKPEAVTKRLKLFMYGGAGAGKTTASVQFPKAYIIDGEKGTDNYSKLISASGGVVFQTTDMSEAIMEVKALLTEKHEYRTLVIDPITALYNDLIDKSEQKVGSQFGRHIAEANKTMKRLANLIMTLDMNVVITAHAKKEYGDNLAVLGETFDAWKQLDYWFDLVIELSKEKRKVNAKRFGTVMKTRIESFPDGEKFEWSYGEIRKRWDIATLERESTIVTLATPEQVAEMKDLLAIVKLPEGTTDKWFSKAGVDVWEDMPTETIAKCLDYVKGRMSGKKDTKTRERTYEPAEVA